ncbi:CinA family protein [Fodinicola feengrottensis]|uniref:CinA family protein n=1 Tax=Fodinicola feengrottensis TaxID=435914 RepID=A0ABP4T272_9ACTN
MNELASQVHKRLTASGQTLAVAESLTGGLLAATIVEVPGVSGTFRGGLVVYATDLKATLAGVSLDLLAERGPVDPEVARQLAAGVAGKCGSDWGLATTGVAGPGPNDGHPAGEVWLGLAGPGGRLVARQLQLAGDRAAVRAEAVERALALLLEWC